MWSSLTSHLMIDELSFAVFKEALSIDRSCSVSRFRTSRVVGSYYTKLLWFHFARGYSSLTTGEMGLDFCDLWVWFTSYWCWGLIHDNGQSHGNAARTNALVLDACSQSPHTECNCLYHGQDWSSHAQLEAIVSKFQRVQPLIFLGLSFYRYGGYASWADCLVFLLGRDLSLVHLFQ